MEYDFDLFVIGGGSGGVRAAWIAGGLGARVGLAEEYRMGGTCVIRGCVPKKLMHYAAHFAHDFADAAGFGWTVGDVSFDWKTLIANKDAEITRLEGLYGKTLAGAGVKTYAARATLMDSHTLDVGGERVTADKILIATGGKPNLPDIPGIEHAITSNEFFHLSEQPKRVAVAGGGYIAVELAGIFNGLGSDTHLIYRGNPVLRGFDDDIRQHLQDQMIADGVTFHTETVLEKIEKADDGLHIHLTGVETLVVDAMLFAIGRSANTADLGLENAGVNLAENGSIPVDAYSRTNVENIFAVGDVTDRVQLTPMAIKEGHAFALTEFGGADVSPEHDNVPSAVFSSPPIGTVGLSEAEAREKLGNIDVYKSTFRPMKYTLGERSEKTLIKLLVDPKSDRVVGAHMCGMDAPEILQGIGIAVKAGLTKTQFDATLAIHPTTAEEFVLMREKA